MQMQRAVSLVTAFLYLVATFAIPAIAHTRGTDEALTREWLARWEQNITGDSRNRYCDKETGEEIGWLISPFSNGFYYGYLATHDTKWLDWLVEWTDAWINRAVNEPDGYVGWPKADGASTSVVPGLYTDNILGEAMGLRPAVLLNLAIAQNPALKAKYGAKARHYLDVSDQVYRKWISRGAWREISISTPASRLSTQQGGVWVVTPFGIDQKTGGWTEGYARRTTDGFTLPANKQNLVALWLIAMYDVTGKKIYRDHAEKWWRVMKSRMKPRERGKYVVWDYWDPAGPWDYKPDGSTKHWVGVHPNGGYYDVDVEGIIAAYEHGLVFTRTDVDRLIATNRDFMWNREVKGAKFQRIDGGDLEERWKDSPGVLWTALVPYDNTLRNVFEANHNPAGWGGLSLTPWYIWRMKSVKH